VGKSQSTQKNCIKIEKAETTCTPEKS